MAEHPQSGLLVETSWLAEHLDDPGVRVVEMAQDGGAFEDGHVPGAMLSPTWQIKGSVETRLVAPPEEARAWFESVGIGDGTLAVGYDRVRCRDASRLWWVLNYYGHENVRVLNGGWAKWSAEGRPVETGPAAVAAGATFSPRPPNRAVVSTAETLGAAIGREDVVIWDVRTEEEFTGANARGNARVGHVPGAVHLEWVRLVDEDGTFKSAEELRAIAEGLGITPDKTVHAY